MFRKKLYLRGLTLGFVETAILFFGVDNHIHESRMIKAILLFLAVIAMLILIMMAAVMNNLE